MFSFSSRPVAEQERGLGFPEFHSGALFIEPHSFCKTFVWINLPFPQSCKPGQSNNPTYFIFFFFLISDSEAEIQEQCRGWLRGMQFSFLWKFSFCRLGVLFSISLPSWYCGAELSQDVDCAERRKKKGRFHLAWIYPGSDFLPEILIWNRFFPLPPRSSLQSLTYAGMDRESVSNTGAGQVLGGERDWHFGSQY